MPAAPHRLSVAVQTDKWLRLLAAWPGMSCGLLNQPTARKDRTRRAALRSQCARTDTAVPADTGRGGGAC